jgi:hypothetical protein
MRYSQGHRQRKVCMEQHRPIVTWLGSGLPDACTHKSKEGFYRWRERVTLRPSGLVANQSQPETEYDQHDHALPPGCLHADVFRLLILQTLTVA